MSPPEILPLPLTTPTVNTLVWGTIMSHLDYYNGFLTHLPISTPDPTTVHYSSQGNHVKIKIRLCHFSASNPPGAPRLRVKAKMTSKALRALALTLAPSPPELGSSLLVLLQPQCHLPCLLSLPVLFLPQGLCICCPLGLEWSSFPYPHTSSPYFLEVFVHVLPSQLMLDVSSLILFCRTYHPPIFASLFLSASLTRTSAL